MREQRFGMYLPIVFLVLMEVIVILQNGVNASAVQRWSKSNRADVVKVDPPSTESTDIRTNVARGLRETKVPEKSICQAIVDWFSSMLCPIFRIIFRQSYIFLSGGKTTLMEDISNLIPPLNPVKPEPESAKPSKNIENTLTSVLDYINPFKPDTSQKEPTSSVHNQTNLIESAWDYINPFHLAANQRRNRQLGNGRFNLDPMVVPFSNRATSHVDEPQHFRPHEDLKKYVRIIMQLLRDISTATLSVELAQYLNLGINSVEHCVLEMKPFRLRNRMEPFQPANDETGCCELNMHVSDPAIDRLKPHKTVRNSVQPSLPTGDLLKHGSLGATNPLTSNSGTANYLHRLRSNYLRRRTPPTN